MLQYSLLLMIGWLDIKDIRNFRQFGSRTPGHPEVEIPGVECTTGPLGQGFAMGVGMAHAEAYLRNLFLQKKITTQIKSLITLPMCLQAMVTFRNQ